MFPGGGSGQYQQGDGWSGPPQQGGDPGQQYPQSYEQPGYGYGYEQQPPAYQQPPSAYEQQPPAYQQPPPGYQQQPPAGYPQPGYGYQQPPGYQPVPVPPRSGVGSHILVVAAVAIVAMLSVVGVAVYLANKSEDPDGPTTASGSTSPAPGPSGDSGGGDAKPPADPADGLVVGTGGVRVDIYVDYQCPPCSTFEAATGDILASNISSGKVTLRIHPVAFIDNRSKNKYATRAAAAAACAHEGGKALEFHTYLLKNQPAEDTAGPTDEDLARAGGTLGLGAAFRSCVTEGKRVGWAAQATVAAQDYGVTSVPAAYVDSKKIDATKAALVNAIG